MTQRETPTTVIPDIVCCVCGSPKLAVGVLTLDKPAVLAAFPQLRPRKKFPLCRSCRSKITWYEVDGNELRRVGGAA